MTSIKKFSNGFFSVRWEGMIKFHQSEIYTFHVSLNGGVKLIIGSSVIIDHIPFATSATVTGDLEVEKDEFYPIVIEYVHQTDEAKFQIEWSSSSAKKNKIYHLLLFILLVTLVKV